MKPHSEKMQAAALVQQEIDSIPHSEEIERHVLGSIILDNRLAREVVEHLSLDDFYLPSHKQIFTAIRVLFKAGSEISATLIAEELKKDHRLEAMGGIAIICGLTVGLPYSQSLSRYVQRLKDASARRRAIRLSNDLIARAKDPSTPWTESAEWAKHQAADLEPATEQSLMQTWKEVRALDLPKGDQIIYELERGELGMINAVAGCGKSTLMRNLILSLAIGRPFANIAVYAKPRRIVLLDFETRLRRLRKDINKMLELFSEAERAIVDENLTVICDCLVNHEPLSLSTGEHMARVVRDVRAFKADIIVVDTISAAFAVQEENSNSEVMRVILKPLAKLAYETSAAVLGVHHVGKSGEIREPVYRGRGASVFGTFPGLTLDLAADITDRERVTLSMPKCKGRRIEPFNLQLDKETRWYSVTDQPVMTVRTTYDLVVGVFEDGEERERREINQTLKGQVSISGITNHLKTAVDRGDLESPRRGRYRRPTEMLFVPTTKGASTTGISEEQ